MFSLFNKAKIKSTVNDIKSTIDDVSRSKYYLDKELHLKGIIYEENKLREELEENEKVVPRVCLNNKSHSPYFDLIKDLKLTYDKSDYIDKKNYIDKNGKVEWSKLLHVKSTRELNEVFIDSLSVNLNIKDVERYREILEAELKEAKEDLGLYKSSWGYVAELSKRLKKLKTNVDFLKKNKLYLESKSYRIRLVVEFDFYGSGSIDVNRQYFKLETVNNLKSINVEFNSEECLQLLKLRDWGSHVKEQINDYLEMKELGIYPGKQNSQIMKNVDDELDIEIKSKYIN